MLDGRIDWSPQLEPDAPATRSGAGALEVHYDSARRRIQIDCHGIWTPEQVDGCFAELKILIEEMRGRYNRVRVFVDRRGSVTQPPATIERLKRHIECDYQPNDRIAVVVDTSLAKIQLRDQHDPQTHKLFLSDNAAATWLSAHD